jgi:hypothetical protein
MRFEGSKEEVDEEQKKVLMLRLASLDERLAMLERTRLLMLQQQAGAAAWGTAARPQPVREGPSHRHPAWQFALICLASGLQLAVLAMKWPHSLVLRQ